MVTRTVTVLNAGTRVSVPDEARAAHAPGAAEVPGDRAQVHRLLGEVGTGEGR